MRQCFCGDANMKDTNKKYFYGIKLRELREELKLKQKDIALMLHIKQNAYSQYETEYITIPIKHLITLCDYYHVSFDYIFNFSKVRSYDNLKAGVDRDLIRDRVKELRKSNDLTQAQLATLINVSKSAISEYERKAKTIATPFLYEICKKYKISADYLLGRVDAPKYLN